VRKLFIASIAMGFGFLGSAEADDWSNYQHDLQNTGLSTASFNPSQLQASWTSPAGFTAPVVAGNEVIASKIINGPGWPTVEYGAFNLATGQELWTNDVMWTATDAAFMNGMMVSFDYSSNLRVYNLTTGALLSDTVIPLGPGGFNPSLVDDGKGGIQAYLLGYNDLARINISSTGVPTLAWKDNNDQVGGGLTIADGSVIATGPTQFYSFDLNTGASNHFYGGPYNGGSASTNVFDQQNQQFYAVGGYGYDSQALSAWQYTNNGNIKFLWEIPNGPVGFGSAALDPAGDLWFVDQSDLLREYSPAGELLRSSSMMFAPGDTPVIQNGYIWVNDASSTYALDINTLDPVETLPGVDASGSAFRSVGVILDDGFILDRGGGANGFTVYSVPEPATALNAASIALYSLLLRRRKRLHDDQRERRPNALALSTCR
jgi:hypothetical protein